MKLCFDVEDARQAPEAEYQPKPVQLLVQVAPLDLLLAVSRATPVFIHPLTSAILLIGSVPENISRVILIE